MCLARLLSAFRGIGLDSLGRLFLYGGRSLEEQRFMGWHLAEDYVRDGRLAAPMSYSINMQYGNLDWS